jgi:hypothetical protein
MPLNPLIGLLGNAGAGIQQGEEFGLQKEQMKLSNQDLQLKNQQTLQQTSAAPLLFLQQRIKAHPELLKDAETMRMVNQYGKPFGIQVDPAKGIDPNFGQYNFLQIVAPEQAARISAELDTKFQTSIISALKTKGDPIAALKMVVATAPPGVDTSGAIAMLNDPSVTAQLQAYYTTTMQSMASKMNLQGAQADHWEEMAREGAALMPYRAQELITRSQVGQATIGLDAARETYMNNSTYLKARALTQQYNEFKQTIGLKIKALNAATSHQVRADLEKELNDKATQARQMANTLIASAFSEQQNGTVDPTLLGQVFEQFNGKDNDDGTHTDGILDLATQFDSAAAGIKGLPYQPTGIPNNVKTTPRGGDGKTVYDQGEKQIVTGGTNKGAFVWKGNIYKKDKSGNYIKSGTYNRADDDTYRPFTQ